VLKESFIGPIVDDHGQWRRRAQPTQWFPDWNHTIDGILPPWRLGNDAYYDPSIASAPPINNVGRWFCAVGVFGPAVGDPERRPQLMLTSSIWAFPDGRYPIALSVERANEPGAGVFYWDPETSFTWGVWHRIEIQLEGRIVTLLLDGRSLVQAPLHESFIGEIGGFHFGAYGGIGGITPPDPVPPEVDFPQGAFCYKANHFVAVRR
jgi:hypothetical protein